MLTPSVQLTISVNIIGERSCILPSLWEMSWKWGIWRHVLPKYKLLTIKKECGQSLMLLVSIHYGVKLVNVDTAHHAIDHIPWCASRVEDIHQMLLGFSISSCGCWNLNILCNRIANSIYFWNRKEGNGKKKLGELLPGPKFHETWSNVTHTKKRGIRILVY